MLFLGSGMNSLIRTTAMLATFVNYVVLPCGSSVMWASTGGAVPDGRNQELWKKHGKGTESAVCCPFKDSGEKHLPFKRSPLSWNTDPPKQILVKRYDSLIKSYHKRMQGIMGLDNLDFLARVLDRTNNKMQRTRTASSKMDVSSDSSSAVHVAFSAAGHQQPGSTGETWTMKGGRRSGRYMVGPTGSVRIRPLNSSSRNSIESTGQRMLRLMGAG